MSVTEPVASTKAKPLVENSYQFPRSIAKSGLDLKPSTIDTIQINLTKLCNQACVHCHVDSSPRRKEAMNDAVIDKVIDLMKNDDKLQTIDITGGAPELHPRFKDLVIELRNAGKKVMSRFNLTVNHDPHPLTKESLSYLPKFYADHGVEVVSSLPCYQEDSTNKQRGDGVYQKSIASLQALNKLGYGQEGSGLTLNLVYNPIGAFLPPDQDGLELTYKKELGDRFGIKFNKLFAITNMPIHRFKAQLRREKCLEDYMNTLVDAYNPQAASGIMCRNIISVSYDGFIYDCDFNQVLSMNIERHGKAVSIFDWEREELESRTIKTADHCFGCTAGAGSSCGGNTAN